MIYVVINSIIFILVIVLIGITYFVVKNTESPHVKKDPGGDAPPSSEPDSQYLKPNSNDGVTFREDRFSLKGAQFNKAIISFGAYGEDKEIVDQEFTTISDIKYKLEAGNQGVQVDQPYEILPKNLLLPDQIGLIKNTTTIQDTTVESTKWKNYFLPNGYNTKGQDGGDTSITYSNYSKSTDDEPDPTAILCSISFNFQFITEDNMSGYISGDNKCMCVDTIGGNPLPFTATTDPTTTTYATGTSVQVGYSFRLCNTHDNTQKFIIRRYGYDANSNVFVPSITGMYVSIQHKSYCFDSFYLDWDATRSAKNEFVLKKIDESTNNHIIWLFLPEINITKPNVPSTSWGLYNSWTKFTDLTGLLTDTDNFVINLAKGKADNYTGGQGPFDTLKVNSNDRLGQQLDQRAGNIVLNYLFPEASPFVFNAIKGGWKLLKDLIKLSSGDDTKYYNIKLPVALNSRVVPEEYSLLQNAPNYSSQNLSVVTDTEKDNVYKVYGVSLNNLIKSQNNFFSSDFDVLLENRLFGSKYEVDGVNGKIEHYPEYYMEAQNDGFVSDTGFTAVVELNNVSNESGTTVCDSVYVENKDNLDTSQKIYYDGNIEWVKKDPYANTTTFRNDYFTGMTDGSYSSSITATGLSFKEFVTSPFFPQLTSSTVLDYLQIVSGVSGLQPTTDESLGKKNIGAGRYTFQDSFIQTDGNGKNLQINVTMTENFVDNFTIKNPGTSFKAGDTVTINLKDGATDPEDQIKLSVIGVTDKDKPYLPRFEQIVLGSNGRDLAITYDGVCLLKNITYLQNNPTKVTDLDFTIDFGGFGFSKQDQIAITATSPLDDLEKVSFVFECIETQTGVRPAGDTTLEPVTSLLSSTGLMTTNASRKPENLPNPSFKFNLTDSNYDLIANPMFSPSQIAYAGTPVPDLKTYYGTSGSVSILRDIFTGLDQGDSKTTLETVLTKKKEEETIDLKTILGGEKSKTLMSFYNDETVSKTNSSMIFLNTLQFTDLNYGVDSDSGASINSDATLVLGSWIPYKLAMLYTGTFYNPAPGVPVMKNDTAKVNLFNYNNTGIIPYGIDHMYDKVLTLDEIPTF